MQGLYAEQRTLEPGISLSQDIARHLYMRQFCGKAVIVTDLPGARISAVRKQWLIIERSAQREKASTLKLTRVQELSRQVAHAQRFRFIASPPQEHPERDVFFVLPTDQVMLPASCQTLYMTCHVERSWYEDLTRQLHEGALVVVYQEVGGPNG